MNIEIINHPNHIEIFYNDLSSVFGNTSTLHLKDSINVLELLISDASVDIHLNTDIVYEIDYTMVSTPVVATNSELYDAIKAFLIS